MKKVATTNPKGTIEKMGILLLFQHARTQATPVAAPLIAGPLLWRREPLNRDGLGFRV